jgi:hypothetical protein
MGSTSSTSGKPVMASLARADEFYQAASLEVGNVAPGGLLGDLELPGKIGRSRCLPFTDLGKKPALSLVYGLTYWDIYRDIYWDIYWDIIWLLSLLHRLRMRVKTHPQGCTQLAPRRP